MTQAIVIPGTDSPDVLEFRGKTGPTPTPWRGFDRNHDHSSW